MLTYIKENKKNILFFLLGIDLLFFFSFVSAGTFTTTRSFSPSTYTPGSPVTVTINVVPPADPRIASYVIEESIPSGWTVSTVTGTGTNNCPSGLLCTLPVQGRSTNTQVNGILVNSTLIKFGVYNNRSPDNVNDVYPSRTITYTVIPPVGASGTQSFSGILYGYDFSLTAYSSVIGGSTSIISSNFHPSDNNPADFLISPDEYTLYYRSYRLQLAWSSPPSPPTPDYYSRAYMIFRLGQSYRYDPAQSCPLCWIPNI